ncbi:hypothetical protein PR202_gb22919 [Eleusine coracana subsp. coracana]|uniref:F-box domain-containing protein n=1 Tax=Eleusine coracana subsp. coracana TaxID=191504 RepID=A0AAV5FII3_ELECO|nr:hypothetical protein PR202_gb22919 [Eleusine coracana subsp. coracana]
MPRVLWPWKRKGSPDAPSGTSSLRSFALMESSPVASEHEEVHHSEYPVLIDIAELSQQYCMMDDLPDALLSEIIKRLTRTSDLNSLSLVSKRLYNIERELRDAIHLGCGLFPVTLAVTSLCSRFPNLSKVEFNYSGWKPEHGIQLDNHGLHVLSSCCQ